MRASHSNPSPAPCSLFLVPTRLWLAGLLACCFANDAHGSTFLVFRPLSPVRGSATEGASVGGDAKAQPSSPFFPLPPGRGGRSLPPGLGRAAATPLTGQQAAPAGPNREVIMCGLTVPIIQVSACWRQEGEPLVRAGDLLFIVTITLILIPLGVFIIEKSGKYYLP